MSRELVIFVEDRYGPQFVKAIAHHILRKNNIHDFAIICETYRPCHNLEKKLHRHILQRVIILIDGDFEPKKRHDNELSNHIKPLKEKLGRYAYWLEKYVKIIPLYVELEEWIIGAYGIYEYHGRKPSEILDELELKKSKYGKRRRYRKKNIAKYVRVVLKNLDKVLKVESFREFYDKTLLLTKTQQINTSDKPR